MDPALDRGIALARRRLKQLDRITGRIVEHDLLAARTADNLVPEPHACSAESSDLGFDVLDDEVDAVPSARSWLTSIRHRTTGGALRSAQQEPERPTDDIGECRSRIRADGESEMRRIEGDRGLDV